MVMKYINNMRQPFFFAFAFRTLSIIPALPSHLNSAFLFSLDPFFTHMKKQRTRIASKICIFMHLKEVQIINTNI